MQVAVVGLDIAKHVFQLHGIDANGKVVAGLKKGGVDPSNEFDKRHSVDGLAGATLTSNGVNRLIKYWLGDHGFGPFLKNLKEAKA